MDTESYLEVSNLDRAGKREEAFKLLLKLADERHPLALVELSSRYFSTEGYSPPVYPLEPDREKSETLAKEGERELRRLAEAQDGEAMRMLGYLHLSLLCPFPKNVDEAKRWLHRAYEAGCYFAANDLHTYYLGSDMEKARYWYREAEKHNCRVVFNEQCEP